MKIKKEILNCLSSYKSTLKLNATTFPRWRRVKQNGDDQEQMDQKRKQMEMQNGDYEKNSSKEDIKS